MNEQYNLTAVRGNIIFNLIEIKIWTELTKLKLLSDISHFEIFSTSQTSETQTAQSADSTPKVDQLAANTAVIVVNVQDPVNKPEGI